GDWKLPVELIQRLFEETDDSITRQAGGKWDSIRREAQRFLGTMPGDVASRYRVQFEGTARQRLQEGIQTGNPDVIAEVATRYFDTEAGFEAANRLGSLHFDRGEFGMASRWFQELRAARAPLTQAPAWKLKAAVAAQRGGDPAVAAS